MIKSKKAKVNREFKDGMFRTLFDDKEKMLELYNAASDEPLGKEAIEGIETLTLETPLYIAAERHALKCCASDRDPACDK